MRQRLGDFLALLVLLAVLLVCFSRLALQPGALIVDGARPSLDLATVKNPRGVGNDLTGLFLPRYQYVTSQLDQCGRIPLWDKSGFAGRPLMGNPQGGLLYPPVWLAWASRSPASLGWLTVGHLLWGGIGAYVLARGLGMGRLAATFTAGCFQASPYLLAHTFEGHYPQVWAASWYPWAFWAFTEFRSGRLRGTFALPPILGMIFLTGHPQEWYYLVFALSIWTAIDVALAVRRGRRREPALKLAAWAGLIALSFGLVAVELLPVIAAQEATLRSGHMTLGRASGYTPQLLNLFQLLDPFALGGPADYFGPHNFWEELLTIGLVPLTLSLIAVTRHPNRERIAEWGTLTATSVIFAAGQSLGLFAILYYCVPGMNRFRVPSRALFLANVAAAVLAGLGIETLRNARLSKESYRVWSRTFGCLVVVLVTALLVLPVYDGRLGSHEGSASIEPHHALLAVSRIVHDFRFWGALGGTFVALWYRGRLGQRRIAVWGLCALGLCELSLYGRQLIQVTPAEQFLKLDPVSAALARVEPPGFGPFRIRARDTYYDDLSATTHGFEKININDWFQVQRAADLYQTLYAIFERAPLRRSDDRLAVFLREHGKEVRQAVLDRLCVAFLVSDHVDPGEPWPIVATGTWKGSEFAIHRNPTVLPRAYVVPRSAPLGDEVPLEKALPLAPEVRRSDLPRIQARNEVIRVLNSLRLMDPRAAVLMSADPLPPGTPRQPFTPAEWVPSDADHVIVRVRTQAPGLLVVADTWMPGWTARVDGKTVPILRGNHAQRVLPLTATGQHEIVMTYDPPEPIRGTAVTALSALVWVVCVIGARRTKRRGQAPPVEQRPQVRRQCAATVPLGQEN